MQLLNLLPYVLLPFGATYLAGAVPTNTTTSTSSAVTPTPSGNSTKLPLNYGVVVFPGFEALDVFGPLEIFNTLSLNYTMNLFIVAQTLDPVSTETNTSAGGSHFSEAIVPTHTFANPPESLDVLLVPGGGAPLAPPPALADVQKYIKDTYPKVQYLITVCTGVGLVARTGLLDGLEATGTKEVWAWVKAQGPNVKWISHARWVHTKNIWTTSGISAGLDGAFDFVRTVYGESAGIDVANRMEYSPITDWKDDKFADLYNLTDTVTN